MRAGFYVAGAATLLVLGCPEQGPESHPPPEVKAATTALASGSVSAPAAPAASTTPPAPLPGPPAASAAAAAHEQAAYQLLAGGADWAGLPEQATDPDAEFDPKLPRRLGPSAMMHPKVGLNEAKVVGRLPKEVVQRVVRQKYGIFRYCYEKGLRADPSLQGRATIRFVIDAKGAVGQVEGTTDQLGPEVLDCLKRAFPGITFPQPEGGVVSVSYSMTFSPGD